MKSLKKYFYLVCAMLFALVLMVGCGNGDDSSEDNYADDQYDDYDDEYGYYEDVEPEAPSDGYLEIYDPLGLLVTVPSNVTTIVSLTPGVTGILIDLGLVDYIVAADMHSSFMYEALSDLPAFDMMNLEVESMIELNPDLVIAHDMIMMGDRENDPLQPLRDFDIAVAYLPAPASLEDISRDINFLGEITRRIDEATELDTTFRNELSEIAEIVAASDNNPTVYFEISPAPDMFTFGSETFQNELLEKVGAINVFADQEGWFPVETESIVESNPDVIFTNAGFMGDPVGEILERAGWGDMDAVANERVYYISDDASSIPNHHVVIALRMMVEYLHGGENDE